MRVGPDLWAGAEAGLLSYARLLHRRPPLRLGPLTIGGRRVAIRGAIALDLPFARLLHFVRDGGDAQPAVLLVAPLSGHFSALLRDAIEALLADYTVYLVDWQDAGTVPAEVGPFGLDDMIANLIRFLHVAEPHAHVLGMSQSAMPVLAAASLMAADRDPAAAS
jgi:polyhydroxyalkanoate depolymerase